MFARVIPARRSRTVRETPRERPEGWRVAVAAGVLVTICLAPTLASAAPSQDGTRSYTGRAAVPAAPAAAMPEVRPAASVTQTAADDPGTTPAQPSEEGTWEDDGDGDDDVWEDDDDGDGDDEAWEDDYDPLRDSPEAIAARRRVVGGAVLIAVGGATVLGALAMGLSDPCARPAGNSCSSAARNRAAVTMGLPAGAILTAGAVVLGLARRDQSRLRLDASVSVGSGGTLSLRGRF